ncbi:MAG: nucleotidyltransferase domain-containing protein [Candidatus Omnitrophota bacterium]
MRRELLLRRELERDTQILKDNYGPEKIILFGSLASGNIKEWSDLDLVVVKQTDKPFLDRLKDIFLLLKPQIGIDVLVYTPVEFEEMKKRPFFQKEILEKGNVIYDRDKGLDCSGLRGFKAMIDTLSN